MYADGTKMTYRDEPLEIISFNKMLDCYIVFYKGKERHVSESAIDRYCTEV